jgi:hypothetical protein
MTGEDKGGNMYNQDADTEANAYQGVIEDNGRFIPIEKFNKLYECDVA